MQGRPSVLKTRHARAYPASPSNSPLRTKMMRALTLATLALAANAFMVPSPLRATSNSAVAPSQTHAAKVR